MSGLVTGPPVGIAEGTLLIVFRKKIGVFLEKIYRKFPTNKISGQFYTISYKVNPVYIAILGCVIILLSCLALFRQ